MYGWSFEHIAGMTIPEVNRALQSDDSEPGQGGLAFDSLEEALRATADMPDF